MTHDEAINTIREALLQALIDCRTEWHEKMYEKARAAIDSLAVKPSEKQCLTCGRQCPNDCPMDKPSEDAIDLVQDIQARTAHDGGDIMHLSWREAAALITARDEQIRREERERCADRAVEWLYDVPAEVMPREMVIQLRKVQANKLRAAIMGDKEGK